MKLWVVRVWILGCWRWIGLVAMNRSLRKLEEFCSWMMRLTLVDLIYSSSLR
jgi:hypothetical protein